MTRYERAAYWKIACPEELHAGSVVDENGYALFQPTQAGKEHLQLAACAPQLLEALKYAYRILGNIAYSHPKVFDDEINKGLSFDQILERGSMSRSIPAAIRASGHGDYIDRK